MTVLPLPRWASQVRQLHWRRLPLLDRWLVQELVGPLLFGIAAFTAVSLSVGVVFELVRRVAESGLPLLAALQVLMAEDGMQPLFDKAIDAATKRSRELAS